MQYREFTSIFHEEVIFVNEAKAPRNEKELEEQFNKIKKEKYTSIDKANESLYVYITLTGLAASYIGFAINPFVGLGATLATTIYSLAGQPKNKYTKLSKLKNHCLKINSKLAIKLKATSDPEKQKAIKASIAELNKTEGAITEQMKKIEKNAEKGIFDESANFLNFEII